MCLMVEGVYMSIVKAVIAACQKKVAWDVD